VQRPLVHLRFDSPLWPYFNRHPSSAIRFVSHLYQARREYRQTCQTAGKSGKYIQMHGHPTLGVKNAKPRLSRNLAPKLASSARNI
jgi:hypothetical protein